MADSIMEDFILDPSMMPKEIKRQASGALVEIETFPFSTSPPSLKKFIKKRGITDEMLNKYALGYTTYHSEMGYRIIFGITYKGILVTYVGRDFLEKQELKYKNYPLEMSAMDPKELLFGYDDIRENQSIIIVEGIIDQMKLGVGAVATLGTSFKDEQIQRLYEKKPKKIFTLYDSEPEAQRRAEKLCSKIWFCPCEIVELTEANDPGELTLKQAEEVKHLLLGGVK
jgi:DNA primase